MIDGYTGEILWLKEGKGTASPDGFFRSLTPEQKEDIEVVSIVRGNAYLKALREHLPPRHSRDFFDAVPQKLTEFPSLNHFFNLRIFRILHMVY